MKNKRLILKSKQRVRREKCKKFNEEVKKIALGINDDKRIKSINSIETYAF